MSGYIDLCRTGYAPFDAVLDAIEDAGNAYHHTAQWQDDDNGEPSHIKRINEKITDAYIALRETDTIQVSRAEYEALRRDSERWRVASTSRNFGITNWCEFGQRFNRIAERIRENIPSQGSLQMTNILDAVEPCPFCGMKPDMSDPDTLYPSGTVWRYEPEFGLRSYHRFADRKEGDGICYLMHCSVQAGGCGAEMHGDSKEEVLAKWNRRIVFKDSIWSASLLV